MPRGKTEKDAEIQELARNCSNYRIASQALTYGGRISSAYKNNTDENGAMFIGVDFHRQKELGISKLPTAQESTFDTRAGYNGAKIYEKGMHGS